MSSLPSKILILLAFLELESVPWMIDITVKSEFTFVCVQNRVYSCMENNTVISK